MKLRAFLFALLGILGLGILGGPATAAPTVPMTAPARSAAAEDLVVPVHGYHCYRAWSNYSGWHRSCYRPKVYYYPRYKYKAPRYYYKPKYRPVYKYKFKYKYH